MQRTEGAKETPKRRKVGLWRASQDFRRTPKDRGAQVRRCQEKFKRAKKRETNLLGPSRREERPRGWLPERNGRNYGQQGQQNISKGGVIPLGKRISDHERGRKDGKQRLNRKKEKVEDAAWNRYLTTQSNSRGRGELKRKGRKILFLMRTKAIRGRRRTSGRLPVKDIQVPPRSVRGLPRKKFGAKSLKKARSEKGKKILSINQVGKGCKTAHAS